MATGAATSTPTWTQRIWLDLQPTPGRMSATLRILLASMIALILVEVWHVPFASIALYFVFLIGRDSPSISLRTGVLILLTVVAAVAAEMAVVIASNNDPFARVMGVAVITFISGMLVVALAVPTLGAAWGLIFALLIASWERHAPEEVLVENSLWIIGAFSIAIGSTLIVEYLFNSRDPARLLVEERRSRYRALVDMFTLYAEGANTEQLHLAVSRVARLAVAGQGGMQRLYNSIVDRNLDVGSLPIGTRVRIPMLAQLMDVAAAFGFQNHTVSEDPEIRKRCAQIAAECKALLDDRPFVHGAVFQPEAEQQKTLIERVEANLHVIASMPSDFSPERDREMVALPSVKTPLLITSAFRDPNTWYFGLKISLCATLVYIFYWAVDWPGISTCVTTVMITGLTTTGAIKQRLALRLAGAILGGLILGLGCTIFVFPLMDSITALAVLVGVVVFACAWVAAGRQFGYLGAQTIFAFYIVAFEDFSAPTQLAPARDRLAGILLALLVMWFVFDQIWPVRTVTAMRHLLASILRQEAELFRLELEDEPHEVLVKQADALRDYIGKTMASIRTLSDVVEYEFGAGRERQMHAGQKIMGTSLAAVALAWNEFAAVRRKQDPRFASDPRLGELRRSMHTDLNVFADSVSRKASVGDSGSLFLNLCGGSCHDVLHDPQYSEYAQNTINRFQDLESFVVSLESEV